MAMPLLHSGKNHLHQAKIIFSRNYTLYFQEALGLAIFMISACCFTVALESPGYYFHELMNSPTVRTLTLGILMGSTALFIFYAPFTAGSGSHINPSVTITFLRLNKIGRWDALFYILFQTAGGTIAVFMMQWLIGPALKNFPIQSVATTPKINFLSAFTIELLIAFVTMSVVLLSSVHKKLSRFTRIMVAMLVCTWVIVAGPLTGFGMNPARSFASALAANEWTGFWIYVTAPLAGMLLAAELFTYKKRI